MKLNKPNKIPAESTYEGGPAARITPLQGLRRSVLSCLLWESEFYEDGTLIADRIEKLAADVPIDDLANLAGEARLRFNLRHVPLLLLSVLIKRGGDRVADAIAATINRPDELTELLAIYWRNGKRPLSKQMKVGLGRAFARFDEYALAKYDRDGAIKLRDVLRLTHPKPANAEQSALWDRVNNRTLETPDTWEVALSGGADKGAAFTRLISEGKLGYLALLRNLRNMSQAGVDRALVNAAIRARKGGADRVLPFRYIAAARAAPMYEQAIDEALIASVGNSAGLDGTTYVLVDVSGSMKAQLSGKSDLTRMDAAAALACVIKGDVRKFSFSDRIVEVPSRLGMAGIDALIASQRHNGTNLSGAIADLNLTMRPQDRLIVVTDEQADGFVPQPVTDRSYLINVACARNGVGYGGKWVHLDGFSEAVLRFIAEYEK